MVLTVALAGPFIGSVLCDWTCAATHQQPVTSISCHGHGDPQSTPAIGAGHQCHDLASQPDSILTVARQAGAEAPAIVESIAAALSAESAARGVDISRGVAHAPPLSPLATLRI